MCLLNLHKKQATCTVREERKRQNVLKLKVIYTHHGEEVVEALDLSGHLGELLVKGIRDIVCWVSGDDKHRLPRLGELHGQATTVE